MVNKGVPLGGTGSYPCPPQGWQLSILRVPMINPLKGPWMRNASRAYSEQVGTYRQVFGNKGEISHW